MKRYDLRCGYCGTSYHVNYVLLMIRLVIRGDVYHKCPHCHRVSRYRLISHIVHDVVGSTELESNKMIREECKR